MMERVWEGGKRRERVRERNREKDKEREIENCYNKYFNWFQTDVFLCRVTKPFKLIESTGPPLEKLVHQK